MKQIKSALKTDVLRPILCERDVIGEAHTILFEKSSFISNDLGIKKIVHEAIKTKFKLNNSISLNKDLGEYSLNFLCTNLIENDVKNNIKQELRAHMAFVTR